MHEGSLDDLPEEARLALERQWYAGELLPHLGSVLAFARANRDEIRARAGSRDPRALYEALDAAIVAHRSLDLREEMAAQAAEMANELWYRGADEGCRDRVLTDWVSENAAAFRAWRTLQYRAVAARIPEPELLALFLDPGD